MTDIDSALNGVLGALGESGSPASPAGTTALAGPEVTGYLDRVAELPTVDYGDVGSNGDIAEALNTNAAALATLQDAARGYREVVDKMVVPALAAQASEASATPTSAATFPLAGAGSADELLAASAESFATLSDGVSGTEVVGGSETETKSAPAEDGAADDAADSEGSDTEEKSGPVEPGSDNDSGDVSTEDLETKVSSAAPAAMAPPMAGGLPGAAPNPGALLTSLSSAAPMMSGMLGGPSPLSTGYIPSLGSMGSASGAAPQAPAASTSGGSRGVSTSEILQMIRDAKANAASTHTSSAGSSLSSPSSSSTPSTASTFSPSRIGDTGSSVGASSTGSSSASGSSGSSAPAIGRTVAGGSVDPALVSGRSVSTSLSAASPSSGGGGGAAAAGGRGGMGMMPMGAMGGMGGSGGGSGSGSSSSKYLERLGELRNDNPYLNGTWARDRTVSGVMASAGVSAAGGTSATDAALSSPGTPSKNESSVTELRSRWA